MSIEDVIQKGVDLIARVTVSHVIADAQNAGREAAFDEFSGEFRGAMYSALMDDHVCDFCASLDGLHVDFETEEGRALYDKYSPAQHENCRCTWIYIDKDIARFVPTENFEKTWEDRYRERTAGKKHADLDTHQIIDRFARFNWQSRPELWGTKDLEKFQQIATAKRDNRIAKKLDKQYRNLLKRWEKDGIIVRGGGSLGEGGTGTGRIIKVNPEADSGKPVETTLKPSPGVEVTLHQYGKNQEEIDRINEAWKEIPSFHFDSLKRVEVSNSPLKYESGAQVNGGYNRLSREIALTRSLPADRLKEFNGNISQTIADVSLHEIGHHCYETKLLKNKEIYDQFMTIHENTIINRNLGLKSNWIDEKEFFADMYRSYVTGTIDMPYIDKMREGNMPSLEDVLSQIFRRK